MPTPTSILGQTMDIRPGQPGLDLIPAAMNDFFTGWKLLRVKSDTGSSMPRLSHSYHHFYQTLDFGRQIEFEDIAGTSMLSVPIGSGIHLLATPLIVGGGETYWPNVTIGIEHVAINEPYWYDDCFVRVEWHMYLFLHQSRIE